jgi:hypothetical protein
MHDATKQLNELAGDLKTSPIGELANHVRGRRPDQSDCIKRRRAWVACIIQVDTTQQHNTHITDVREIWYSWHPWHGRAVRVHASLVKRGQAVAHCSLEDVQACRVLEVPLWMLDVAACCKTRASKPGFASAQSLRDLKEVLQAARPQVPAPIAPKTQPRYLLHAGGADGGIDGPAEIEPTRVVCSSAMQSALDESVVRCSTKDRAIAGAVTETASSNSGRSRNRRGGPR